MKKVKNEVFYQKEPKTNIEVEQEKVKLPLSFYFSLVTTAFFIVLTVAGIMKSDYKVPELRYVSIAFICIYTLVFIGITIYGVVTRNSVKSNMKSMKTTAKSFKLSMKVLNKLVVFINLATATALIVVAIKEGAPMDFKTYFLILASVLSLITMVVFFIKSGFKFKKTIKKEKKRKAKERLKSQK